MKRLASITLAAAIVLTGASAASAHTRDDDALTVDGDTRIQAEDFTSGVDHTPGNAPGAYRDVDGVDIVSKRRSSGYYVGWTSRGESVSYDVKVVAAGDYTADFRLRTRRGLDLPVEITVDGTSAGIVTVPGASTRRWTPVPLSLGTLAAGEHTITVTFRAGGIKFDRFDLSWSPGEIQPTEPVTPPPTEPVTPPAENGAGFPGQPSPGDVAWGASYRQGSDTDVVARYENAAGNALEVHRTFYQWDQMDKWMLTTVTADLDAGRIPWVSVKGNPDGNVAWQAIADGAHDAELDAALLALEAFGSPIWLTMHHEPEGGGGVNSPDDPAGPAAHVAMNAHVRDRMTALGIENVALAPILMSYTWKDASGRNVDEWWAPGIYDFLGVDIYAHSGGITDLPELAEIRQWAAERDMEIGIGEWGMRADAAAVREWYEYAISSAGDGGGARIMAQAVWDNPGAKGWLLNAAEVKEFNRILSEQ